MSHRGDSNIQTGHFILGVDCIDKVRQLTRHEHDTSDQDQAWHNLETWSHARGSATSADMITPETDREEAATLPRVGRNQSLQSATVDQLFGSFHIATNKNRSHSWYRSHFVRVVSKRIPRDETMYAHPKGDQAARVTNTNISS